MREGRTRAATTSRSVPAISRPTPEPKASSLRTSLGMEVETGMPGLIAPSHVVPAQNMNRRIVSRGHEFHLRGHGALQVGKLAIGEAQLRGCAQGDDGIATHP